MKKSKVINQAVPFAVLNIEEEVERKLQYERPLPEGYYDEQEEMWRLGDKPLFWCECSAGRQPGDKTYDDTIKGKYSDPDDMGWD